MLTDRQARFCQEYIVDLVGTQAAIRAGYSPKTANQQAVRLLANVSVQAEIQRLMAARSERVEITQDEVLRRLWAKATADVNELVEYRVRCCRHCWGKRFRHQETPAEQERRRADWAKVVTRGDDNEPIEAFDEQGGLGWDPRKDPNPKCPECFGQGFGDVVVKDSARASDAARQLYAGVKVTKDGLQVLLNSKDEALIQVGRHLGMFPSKIQASGPDDGPIEVLTTIELVGVRAGGDRETGAS